VDGLWKREKDSPISAAVHRFPRRAGSGSAAECWQHAIEIGSVVRCSILSTEYITVSMLVVELFADSKRIRALAGTSPPVTERRSAAVVLS
jgi:hypothetical protein